jgi:hypothetical protein
VAEVVEAEAVAVEVEEVEEVEEVAAEAVEAEEVAAGERRRCR